MTEKFSLVIVQGPDTGKEFHFQGQVVTIGRKSAANEINLDSRTVSRQHARITREKEQYFLQDLNSANRTVLNKVPLANGQKARIKHGDEFRLGDMVLRFVAQGDLENDPAHVRPVATAAEKRRGGDRKAGRTPAAPLLKRKPILLLAAGLAGLLLVLGMVKAMMRDSPVTEGTPADLSAQPIALPAPDAYGLLRTDKAHPDKAIFTFTAESKRAKLYFTPGGIDADGEVEIRLNETHIGNVPLAIDGWGTEQMIALKADLLIRDKENRLVFDNTRNPPGQEMWGVRDVRIEFLPVGDCRLEAGRRLFGLGENMYAEKAISDGNVFRAMQYYAQAFEKAGECEPPPDFLPALETQLATTQEELAQRFKMLQFSYKKSIQIDNYPQAEKDLEAILRLIPDPKDWRNKEADRLLARLREVIGE